MWEITYLTSSFLHLRQHKPSNLGGGVLFALDLNPSVATLVDDLKRHVLDVLLSHRVVEPPSDQSFGGEYRTFRILDGLR